MSRTAFAAAFEPLARATDFGGRSRRSELLLFYVLTMLAGTAIHLALAPLGWAGAKWAAMALYVAVALPWPALLVRRVHDVGYGGWWLAPLLPLAAFNLWTSIEPIRGPFGMDGQLPLALELAVGLYLLGTMLLLLWDDEEGANRFGANPRHGAPKQAA